MGQYHDQTFPNENTDYRAARDALLTEEIELRHQAEKVASMRRGLPLGGAVSEDYAFENLDGETISMSALFSDKSPNLLIYSFMFSDGGNACPACNSLLDGLNGNAAHIRQKLNLAVVARAGTQQLKSWASARGWSQFPLYSCAGSNYPIDYKSESDDGSQLPMMSMFRKTEDGIFHTWASEMFYASNEDGQHPRHADQIWPLWNFFDLTADGRPDDWFPAYSYDEE